MVPLRTRLAATATKETASLVRASGSEHPLLFGRSCRPAAVASESAASGRAFCLAIRHPLQKPKRGVPTADTSDDVSRNPTLPTDLVIKDADLVPLHHRLADSTGFIHAARSARPALFN